MKLMGLLLGICYLTVVTDSVEVTETIVYRSTGGYTSSTGVVVNSSTTSRRPSRARRGKIVRKIMRSRTQDGTIRLQDGANDHEGRVEIFHDNRWGPICDDEWDDRDAQVVCRQLGYHSGTVTVDYKVDVKATHAGKFGGAKGRYWLDNVMCDGSEEKLTDCLHDGWGIHDCTNVETAGVVCAKTNPTEADFLYTTTTPPPISRRIPIEKAEVRLQGGRVPTEGRVEVRLSKRQPWGLICGDGWTLLEAAVVCRQLGLGFAQDAPQTDFFGGSFDDIVMLGAKCNGTEGNLVDCTHEDKGNRSVFCPGNQRNFASVICTTMLPDLEPDPTEVQRSAYLEDKQLYFLQCAMEENCLASSAYRIKQENAYGWHLETRRLLRFTAKIRNIGNADFRPQIPKHMWQFHACHLHYHSMEVFAVFDIIDYAGRKVAEGHKASFCLEDNDCRGPAPAKKYNCANFGDQGISVGCADIYRSNIDCQWIDVTDLLPGVYTFKFTVNGEMKVAESDFSNNSVECRLHFNEMGATITGCHVTRP